MRIFSTINSESRLAPRKAWVCNIAQFLEESRRIVWRESYSCNWVRKNAALAHCDSMRVSTSVRWRTQALAQVVSKV
jgi:hypothetical protein